MIYVFTLSMNERGNYFRYLSDKHGMCNVMNEYETEKWSVVTILLAHTAGTDQFIILYKCDRMQG